MANAQVVCDTIRMLENIASTSAKAYISSFRKWVTTMTVINGRTIIDVSELYVKDLNLYRSFELRIICFGPTISTVKRTNFTLIISN